VATRVDAARAIEANRVLVNGAVADKSSRQVHAGDAIVIEGELTLIMDIGETVVRAGDIIIQRGTNHGWANRSNSNCRIAFVLIDGRYQLDTP
jgi:quercetin dioxygenase-like cupin family protein